MEEFSSNPTCTFSAFVMSINTLTQAPENLIEFDTKLYISSCEKKLVKHLKPGKCLGSRIMMYSMAFKTEYLHCQFFREMARLNKATRVAEQIDHF